MSSGVLGIQLDCVPEMGQCLSGLAQTGKTCAQVVGNLGFVGVESDGLAEFSHGVLCLALDLQTQPKIVVRLRRDSVLFSLLSRMINLHFRGCLCEASRPAPCER